MADNRIDFNRIIGDAEKLVRAECIQDDILLEEKEASGPSSKLYLGDNLPLLKKLVSEGTKAEVIYIDPPFFSDASYDAVSAVSGKAVKFRAYDDRWPEGREAYLTELSARLILMRELLSEKGVIWLHLDWHVSHYAKVLMDMIFGEENFVNEIIWTYKSGGSTKRRFARKHDSILLYSKTGNYKFNTLKEKSYNRGLKPYRFKGVEEFEDENGWYTVVNMKDVWEIDMVGRTSGERTGYATQKPEKLMERIIESTSDKGDLCCDFFSGSGAFAATAARLGRNVIASDISPAAVQQSFERLAGHGCARLYAIQEAFDGVNGADGPEEESNGRFDVELAVEPGEGAISVSIDAISEEGLRDYMDAKSADIAEKALSEAPWELIKGMSAGIDSGDGVHREIKRLERGADGEMSERGADGEMPGEDGAVWQLEVSEEEIKKKNAQALTVKVWDVLGNFTYKSVPAGI